MIIYSGPMEEDTENPTKAFLKDIIFNKQEDYWKKGVGDSCISIEGCNERLIVVCINFLQMKLGIKNIV